MIRYQPQRNSDGKNKHVDGLGQLGNLILNRIKIGLSGIHEQYPAVADTVECQGKIIAALTDTDNPHLERGIGWKIVSDCFRCGGLVVIGFNKAFKIKIGHG